MMPNMIEVDSFKRGMSTDMYDDFNEFLSELNEIDKNNEVLDKFKNWISRNRRNFSTYIIRRYKNDSYVFGFYMNCDAVADFFKNVPEPFGQYMMVKARAKCRIKDVANTIDAYYELFIYLETYNIKIENNTIHL